MDQKRILIIGGTTGARRLLYALSSVTHLCVYYSLAGVTGKAAIKVGGRVIKGGFGGVEGLYQFIRLQAIDLVIDASHAYAQTISANAQEACQKAGCKYIVLRQMQLRVSMPFCVRNVHITQISKKLPRGARVFSTLGAQGNREGLALRRRRRDIFLLTRQIVPTQKYTHISRHQYTIYARPPYTVQQEYRLMKRYRIQYVLTRETITPKTIAKFIAAKRLGIRVMCIKKQTLSRTGNIKAGSQAIHPYPFYHYLQVKRWIFHNFCIAEKGISNV